MVDKKQISGLVFVLIYITFFWTILFWSAGTINLPFAWITLAIYLLTSVSSVFLVEPGLISERLQFGGKGVNRKDQILASVSFLFFFPLTLLVAGLDLGRFGWTQSFPSEIQIAGVVLYAFGNFIARWAVASNRFFSTFVRIQEDRGHVVESGGPYRFIRHPGYAGAILAAVALPLALGSLYALVPALIGSVGLIIRTNLEDNQLRRDLAGYLEYSIRVRYRLFPGGW